MGGSADEELDTAAEEETVNDDVPLSAAELPEDEDSSELGDPSTELDTGIPLDAIPIDELGMMTPLDGSTADDLELPAADVLGKTMLLEGSSTDELEPNVLDDVSVVEEPCTVLLVAATEEDELLTSALDELGSTVLAVPDEPALAAEEPSTWVLVAALDEGPGNDVLERTTAEVLLGTGPEEPCVTLSEEELVARLEEPTAPEELLGVPVSSSSEPPPPVHAVRPRNSDSEHHGNNLAWRVMVHLRCGPLERRARSRRRGDQHPEARWRCRLGQCGRRAAMGLLAVALTSRRPCP